MSQGHWVGLEADPDNYLGFVYLIEDLTTGRKYIGKKNFWVSKPKVRGCKSKSQDKGSPKWKQCCWKESNWKVYKGSSKTLAKHMKDNPKNEYRYTILHHCRSKGVLSYTECKEMYDRRVLEKLLPNGEYEYFNLAIGAIKFRPKDHHSEETRQKMSTTGKARGISDDVLARMADGRVGNTNCVGREVGVETRKLMATASARLKEWQVLEIIQLLKQGFIPADIAVRYGVSRASIYDIQKVRTWKHIPRG